MKNEGRGGEAAPEGLFLVGGSYIIMGSRFWDIEKSVVVRKGGHGGRRSSSLNSAQLTSPITHSFPLLHSKDFLLQARYIKLISN